MNDLVILTNGVPMVDSVLVAKKFGKVHRDVMRSINNLECSDEFRLRNFAQSSYTVRGHNYDSFMMTKDGFSFLCMGFTGVESARWKEAYINAFNSMETALKKTANSLEWKQARIQSKEVRKDVSNAIKMLVDYATKQGSSSAQKYYSNITKMEYAALELIQSKEKVPSNFRDTLDLMDLCFLQAAEQVCRAAIIDGIEREFPYKEIYKLAKEKVMNYAQTVTFARLK